MKGVNTMNYSRAFSAAFDDKDWISKILIAGLIGLIPVIGQIYILGWAIEIVRRVKAGRTDILPTTHFTYFLTLGLKMVVVSLIYSIPALLVSGIMSITVNTAGNTDSGFITVLFTGVGCVGGILGLIVNIAVYLLTTYGSIKLAETDQIKACLDFKDAFYCIKNNLSAFIIVALLAVVAGIIESAGIIICVGIIFTVPYGTSIVAHLYAQLWDNLKPYDTPAKPFRGSVKDNTVEDVIEEAPFTMVQDIENSIDTAAEEAKETAEETADTAEDILESLREEAAEKVEDAADKAEEIAEEAAETAKEAAEKAAEAVEEAKDNLSDIVSDVKDDDNTDSDLPKFE